MEISDLFIDDEGDLLYGQISIKNDYSAYTDYYSEIVEGVYLLPFDFTIEEKGINYRFVYTGIDKLDFLSYDVKKI